MAAAAEPPARTIAQLHNNYICWAGLGWAGLGWAWLGWQGLGPLGDSETVRCQMLAVADTGHWTVGQKYD